MGVYVARRLLQAIPLLLFISMLVFLVMHLTPGGPLARLQMDPQLAHGINLKRLAHIWGLDQPLYVQYYDWLRNMLSGNWGYSFVTHEKATTMIAQAIGPTVLLLGSALVVTVLLGVPLGIFQAVYKYSLFDYVFTFLAFFFFSFPTFFLALLLLLVFAVKFGWFPAGGMVTVGAPFSLGDLLHHLILPMMTLALISIAGYSRYMRSSMLDVIGNDYIRTARAKGLPGIRVILKHAVRNALIPVLTILALDIAGIFSGAVITEYVYSWPGMGSLFINAAFSDDYSVLMAILIIASALVVVFNLVADVVYALVDPRISYA